MAGTDKVDLYKAHKADYITPRQPALVDIARATYLTIDGQGEPGGAAFEARIAALYATAFTIKMTSKFAGQDYIVCKLEGLWWTDDRNSDFLSVPKDQWRWKLLIRTPSFIQRRQLASTRDTLLAKGKPAEVREVKLETIHEGRCVQMLHVGPYEAEAGAISAMQAFAAEQGMRFHGLHHEIYLSDPRRVSPDRLRTILRHPVKRLTG